MSAKGLLIVVITSQALCNVLNIDVIESPNNSSGGESQCALFADDPAVGA